MELVKTTVKDPPPYPSPCVCMLVSAWLCSIESGEPRVWWLSWPAVEVSEPGQGPEARRLRVASWVRLACGVQRAGALWWYLMSQKVLTLSP